MIRQRPREWTHLHLGGVVETGIASRAEIFTRDAPTMSGIANHRLVSPQISWVRALRSLLRGIGVFSDVTGQGFGLLSEWRRGSWH